MDPVGEIRWNKGYKKYFTSRFKCDELFHPKKGGDKNNVDP